MDSRERTLLVVAHPDDEVIWFSSVLTRCQPVDLVVVTCGSDNASRASRLRDLRLVVELYGVSSLLVLDHPDIPGERLDVKRLSEDLRNLVSAAYGSVYTHGQIGETYENPHHQDVSYVVHQLFDRVRSVAWNQFPSRVVPLSRAEFRLKQYAIGSIYWTEYAKLRDAYPLLAVESFSEYSAEASEIFYWGIANFGDNHERLGAKFTDLWGYRDSPYELERHDRIVQLIRGVEPSSLCEVGSGEGELSLRLSAICDLTCVEPASSYRNRLRELGFEPAVPSAMFQERSAVLFAAVLEYMSKAERDSVLSRIIAQFIITDCVPSPRLSAEVSEVLRRNGYESVSVSILEPRWEEMYHTGIRESIDVYKEGSLLTLWRRRQ